MSDTVLFLDANAYRQSVGVLAAVAKNPPRSEAEVHAMLGRRHPRTAARFADLYESVPVPADSDQPKTLFRGVVCIRCGAPLESGHSLSFGLCAQHAPAPPAW